MSRRLNAEACAAYPDRDAMSAEDAAMWYMREVAAVSRLPYSEAKVNRILELVEWKSGRGTRC